MSWTSKSRQQNQKSHLYDANKKWPSWIWGSVFKILWRPMQDVKKKERKKEGRKKRWTILACIYISINLSRLEACVTSLYSKPKQQLISGTETGRGFTDEWQVRWILPVYRHALLTWNCNQQLLCTVDRCVWVVFGYHPNPIRHPRL